MIAVVDYGIGNVRSVLNAIEYIGEDGIITSSKNEIDDASHIILPGVGSFGNGIERLRKTGLDEVLHEQVFSKGKHVLGICLGLQCAVIDFARNVSNLDGANSREFKKRLKYPVIDIMPKQKKIKNKGATMRLGSYSCDLVKKTKVLPIFS